MSGSGSNGLSSPDDDATLLQPRPSRGPGCIKVPTDDPTRYFPISIVGLSSPRLSVVERAFSAHTTLLFLSFLSRLLVVLCFVSHNIE